MRRNLWKVHAVFKHLKRRVLATGAAIAVAAGIAVGPQAGAQDLSSQIQRDIASAVDQAATEWENFVRMATESLGNGSSLPVLPNGPVANGQNGELSVNGRSYLVWIPAKYNPSRPMPVVVGYSALGNSAEDFRDYSRLRESSAGRDAIIVYPRAIGASWEGQATAATGPGEDIAFVRAMIDDLGSHYNIDRSRIYATGMSAGGGMAAVSACHMADLFAGVASVSGAYYAPVNMNCQNLPIAFYAIHGMNDQVTPYYGGERRGTRVLNFQEVFASYERRNGCAGGLDVSPAAVNASRVSARGCAKPVQVVKVEGGGHEWFTYPNAAEEVWAFLSKQSK